MKEASPTETPAPDHSYAARAEQIFNNSRLLLRDEENKDVFGGLL